MGSFRGETFELAYTNDSRFGRIGSEAAESELLDFRCRGELLLRLGAQPKPCWSVGRLALTCITPHRWEQKWSTADYLETRRCISLRRHSCQMNFLRRQSRRPDILASNLPVQKERELWSDNLFAVVKMYKPPSADLSISLKTTS
jgi:hypothetical protein